MRALRSLIARQLKSGQDCLTEKKLFEYSIEQKWSADSSALGIDQRLRPLYMTIHRFAFAKLYRFPNLVKPENFNDRIHWLMLFDQQELEIQCSDKLKVRDFVADRVGSNHLAELLGCADTLAEFERFSLPQNSVVKTNHDSGTVFVSSDLKPYSKDAMLPRLRTALARVYGVEQGEWPYAFIKPRILIEERLEQEGATQPADVKFHCVNGRVAFIHYICERDISAKEIIFTTQWERLPVRIYFPQFVGEVPQPRRLEEMIEIAESLASGFKYVRVDLYDLGNRIVVGELTFFPMAGTYSGYGVYEIEPYMRFDLCSRKPAITDGHTIFAEMQTSGVS
jgi:hypothetical protein